MSEPIPVKQLLLSKYLFLQARDAFNRRNPMSAGLAISLLQDSAEALVWTIAKTCDADVKDREGFVQVWDKIKTAPKNVNSVDLPFRPKMLGLNNARVAYKHYGNLPDPSDAEKHIVTTEEFLRETMERFFSTNFDDLSMIDMIVNEPVRAKLREAEDSLRSARYEDAMTSCAEAEILSTGPLEGLLPKPDHSIGQADDLFGPLVPRTIPRPFSPFGSMCSYVKRVSSVVLATAAGVSLPDCVRFKELAPRSSWTPNGVIFFKHSPPYTEDEARFAVKFVTDLALAIEQKTAHS